MTVLTINSTLIQDRLVLEKSRQPGSTKITQSMNSRHVCPCCSNPLLRHIGLGKLYWRCNHCFQAMPVMEDAQEIPSFAHHMRALQPLTVHDWLARLGYQ
jgi:hypothetical protein